LTNGWAGVQRQLSPAADMAPRWGWPATGQHLTPALQISLTSIDAALVDLLDTQQGGTILAGDGLAVSQLQRLGIIILANYNCG
jgi:hypothetical protein